MPTKNMVEKAFEILAKIFQDDKMEDRVKIDLSSEEGCITLPVTVCLEGLANVRGLDYVFVGDAVEIYFHKD